MWDAKFAEAADQFGYASARRWSTRLAPMVHAAYEQLAGDTDCRLDLRYEPAWRVERPGRGAA